MIREQREQRKQEVAFNARPFVLCGIPLRPLPKDQLIHRRRNGRFFLHIIGHPDFGLPTARSEHTTTLLSNGEVLAVGGTSRNGAGFLASAELYTP